MELRLKIALTLAGLMFLSEVALWWAFLLGIAPLNTLLMVQLFFVGSCTVVVLALLISLLRKYLRG